MDNIFNAEKGIPVIKANYDSVNEIELSDADADTDHMIYDRTLEDIEKSKNLRSNKVQKNIPLSDSEKQILERGTITENTLNRIENKQSEIQIQINDMGYYNTHFYNKEWSESDVFKSDDFERIIDNTQKVREAFFINDDTPIISEQKLRYDVINFIEKILHDVSENIPKVKENYLICNTFYSGGNKIND